MTEFQISSNLIFGAGATDALGRYCKKNVTVITDAVMKENGICDRIVNLLRTCNVSVYDKVMPDPTLTLVTDCLKFVTDKGAEVIVALGGGSAIDTAKAVILVLDGMNVHPEFVAIPTTSGTGSEVTNYTVIRDEDAGRKIPLADDRMIPDLAILDYKLTKTVPPKVTAFTGMDVITHAFEAYVAKGANPITDAYAEKALKLAFEWLPEAYKNGDDDAARENMMMASYLAGLAFTKAGLGICHSISHAVGAAFHIPHGEANAITLPHVIAFNSALNVPFGADKSPTAKRYAEIARIIGLPAAGTRLSVQYLVREINKLINELQIPSSLLQAGVNLPNYTEHRGRIIQAVLEDICTTANPVDPDAGQIGAVLDRVFGKMLP